MCILLICIYTNIFTVISIVTLFIRNKNLEQYKCLSLVNGKNIENEPEKSLDIKLPKHNQGILEL